MSDQNIDVVAIIEDVFERRGADSYLGEDVTMSQHMLQAALQAEQSGAEDDVIVAALLHDIGHYTNEFPEDALEQGQDNYHQNAGARILQSYFPEKIVNCVKHHVDAKRYLCATRSEYYDSLSDASKYSLELQGGPFSTEETEAFAKLDHLDNILQVRIWDDLAKDREVKTPPFSYYLPKIRKIVDQHAAD